MAKILITGATGFVGQSLVESLYDHTDWLICSLERLPVAEKGLKQGHFDPENRIQRIYHDIRAEIPEMLVKHVQDADYIVHLAADVSAAKSLCDPQAIVETNVIGTYNMLELARRTTARFVYVSTGEVLGPVPFPFKLDESKPLRPTSPYAASKAAGEALVNAYRVSFELNTIVVRPMNMFGSGQVHGFVPKIVKSLLKGETVKCHYPLGGGGRNWLEVNRFSNRLRWLLDCGKAGETYHVVGPELHNRTVIEILANALHRDPNVEDVLNTGERYSLEDTKLCNDFDHVTGIEDDLILTARELADQYE
jgi:dTDP-glucose 4,6-dehydratase